MARRGFLHVLNGDSPRGTLEQSVVPGVFLAYPDVLHEGPTPFRFDDEWRRARSQFLASQFPASSGQSPSETDIQRRYREKDAALEGSGDYDEVVFWFEHDLYDQLLLIRHLCWLSRVIDHRDRRGTRFSLICIGEFPGVPDFVGLGQLDALQLASLFDRREPITDAQVALGSRSWEAFCSADPRGRQAFVEPDSALPFLGGAFRRHLEDFPGSADGLSRSERQILRTLEEAPLSPSEAFARAAAMEERIFMGDLTFWAIVGRLASPVHPLIELDVQPRPDRLPNGTMRLTEAGRDVLAGRADHVTLNGLDRWMGGTHLTTSDLWRWTGAALVRP